MDQNDYDVYALTESWLDDLISDAELFGPSYTVFRDDRNNLALGKKCGGGALLAVHIRHRSERAPLTIDNVEQQSVWAKIFLNGSSVVFICHQE